MNRILIITAGVLLLAGCGQTASQQAEDNTQADSAAISQQSVTDSVEPQQVLDIQTMGRVVATRYADVKFEAALPVSHVMVHNGDHVRQGQLLAQLDGYRQENAIEQIQREMEQARLKMHEVIVDQGYDPEQMGSVPDNVRHIAEVKSGYQLAQSKLASARHELTTTRVTAPFDGIVANVTARAGQLSQVGEVVCRIISNQQMNVEFPVMETDLQRYAKGTTIQVCPVANADKVYEASVVEINPIVSDQGTVDVRAAISHPDGLFDGMHVTVISIIKE